MSFSEWKEYKLGDIFVANYGKSLPKKDRVEGKYNVYGSGGITGTHQKALVKGPGIIIGRKGTVGSLYYEKNDYFPIDTVYYIQESTEFDLKFLFYKLETIGLNQMNTHSAVPGLNREHMYSQVTVFPPIKEQKAIANILATLDKKIETNNEINKKLDEMAKAIFKQWFVDFEFPNKEGEPYKSSCGEMVESELGIIPRGWEVSEIDTLTELIIDYRGKTPKKLGREWSEKGITALSAKNVKGGKLINLEQANHVDDELYNLWMKDELKYGDILLTSEAPLGELYFLASNDKYCLSQRLFALRANREYIYPEILFMYLKTENIMNNIKNRATGTTVTGIRQSELRKVKVLKPSKEIQIKYEGCISATLKKINTNEKETFKLINLRDTLLPKLMSGEIRVPIDISEN